MKTKLVGKQSFSVSHGLQNPPQLDQQFWINFLFPENVFGLALVLHIVFIDSWLNVKNFQSTEFRKFCLSYYTYNNKLFQSGYFFSSGSLNRNGVLGLHLDLKIVSSLQYGKSLSILRLSLVLKSNGGLPKYGKVKVNSILAAMKLRVFLINNLFKKVLVHWFLKFWG